MVKELVSLAVLATACGEVGGVGLPGGADAGKMVFIEDASPPSCCIDGGTLPDDSILSSECWANTADLSARSLECKLRGTPLEPIEPGRYEFWWLPAGFALGARSDKDSRGLYAFIFFPRGELDEAYAEFYIERFDDANMIVTDLVGFVPRPIKGRVSRATTGMGAGLKLSAGQLTLHVRGDPNPRAEEQGLAFMALTRAGLYLETLRVERRAMCEVLGEAVALGASVQIDVEGPYLTSLSVAEEVLRECEKPIVSASFGSELGERLAVSAPASNEVLQQLFDQACM